VRPLVEQQVLQALHGLVELLHGGEVRVDHDVEQPPQQEADAVDGQVGRAVPAGQDAVDVEARVLADGDQRAGGDERGQLAGLEPAAGAVEVDAVGGQV